MQRKCRDRWWSGTSFHPTQGWAFVFEVIDNALERATVAWLSVMRVGECDRWLEWRRLPVNRRRRCGDDGLEALSANLVVAYVITRQAATTSE